MKHEPLSWDGVDIAPWRVEFRVASTSALHAGKMRLLKRLHQLRKHSDEINELGLRIIDRSIYSTVVSLRDLER